MPYSTLLTASEGIGPYRFTTPSETLPPGLELSADGLLEGIPTKAGCFRFVVTAVDSLSRAGTRCYTLVICEPITMAASLPSGLAGTPYSATIATGGTPPYTIATSGTLPPGLLGPTPAGKLEGTPTAGGCYTFSVTFSDGCTTITREYTVIICDVPISFSPEVLPPGTAGVPYAVPITASGCTGPYMLEFIAGSLPPGLGSLVTGVPTTCGVYRFTVKATGALGCSATHEYELTIGGPGIPVDPLPDATACASYCETLNAHGGSVVTVHDLPPGLKLMGDKLCGIPELPGDYTIRVVVAAPGCPPAEIPVTLHVDCLIRVSPSHLPRGELGLPYSELLTACGGTPPYTYTLISGSLPAGLSLTPDGTISGIPSAVGCTTFTVRATDSTGCFGEQTYEICITSTALATPALSGSMTLMLVMALAITAILVMRRY